ncbi:MAG TPA: ABC transporter ATP-binding protein [Dyella sp.]|uniref:ABC transporter ATP-binding protein n=1 Tax=Dyella sp. TaxID=1869338 RepID=UPI002F95B342
MSRDDLPWLALYVVLSLGSALTGSLAAVSLVPLMQPGHALPLADGLYALHGSIELQAAIFAGITVGFALTRWQAARLGAGLVSRYGVGLRNRVHARLIDAPLPALAHVTSAEIAQVLTHNGEILIQGFSATLQLLVAGVTCLISLGFACWISPSLVVAVPVLLGVGILSSRMFGREQSRVSRQYVSDLTRLFWQSEDFPRRLRHVRSFEREEAEKAGYDQISARLGQGYRRQLELVASGRLLLEVLAAACIAGVFVLSNRWHGIDQAALIAVSLLLGRLLPYLVSTRQSFQQLRSAVPAFELWQRYMQLPAADIATSVVPLDGTVHIEHMHLQPPPGGLDIRGLALVPGELTLIAGDSGIGKSSLVDVLAGMTPPRAFVARFGERRIGFEDYRRLVRNGAYVSQSVRPWQRTVRDCLRWAAPEASDEELGSALADVGLDKRLASSRDGLDTALSDASSRLSGGELQRVLLAQVILRQPCLAVLDEATGALDAAAERSILLALKRRLPRTILIVVSHRANVAMLADQTLSIGADLVAQVTRTGSVQRAAAV